MLPYIRVGPIRGVEPKAAQSLYGWMTDVYNSSLGRVENLRPAEVEADFRRCASKLGVPRDLIDSMVKAERERGAVRLPDQLTRDVRWRLRVLREVLRREKQKTPRREDDDDNGDDTCKGRR